MGGWWWVVGGEGLSIIILIIVAPAEAAYVSKEQSSDGSVRRWRQQGQCQTTMAHGVVRNRAKLTLNRVTPKEAMSIHDASDKACASDSLAPQLVAPAPALQSLLA